MKTDDILSDILKDRMLNQRMYNENILNNLNPEVKYVFSQSRDDETRDVNRLQQQIIKLTSRSPLINKMFLFT